MSWFFTPSTHRSALCFLPWGFPTKTFCVFLTSTLLATCCAPLFFPVVTPIVRISDTSFGAFLISLICATTRRLIFLSSMCPITNPTIKFSLYYPRLDGTWFWLRKAMAKWSRSKFPLTLLAEEFSPIWSFHTYTSFHAKCLYSWYIVVN